MGKIWIPSWSTEDVLFSVELQWNSFGNWITRSNDQDMEDGKCPGCEFSSL